MGVLKDWSLPFTEEQTESLSGVSVCLYKENDEGTPVLKGKPDLDPDTIGLAISYEDSRVVISDSSANEIVRLDSITTTERSNPENEVVVVSESAGWESWILSESKPLGDNWSLIVRVKEDNIDEDFPLIFRRAKALGIEKSRLVIVEEGKPKFSEELRKGIRVISLRGNAPHRREMEHADPSFEWTVIVESASFISSDLAEIIPEVDIGLNPELVELDGIHGLAASIIRTERFKTREYRNFVELEEDISSSFKTAVTGRW